MIPCESTTKEVKLNENTTFILGNQQWTLVRAITFNLWHNFAVSSKWGCKLQQMSLMKGSWWVLEALCNFQEFVAVEEYFFAAPQDKQCNISSSNSKVAVLYYSKSPHHSFSFKLGMKGGIMPIYYVCRELCLKCVNEVNSSIVF